MILFTHFATLIGLVLDPLTHNRPFADKRDKVGMDGVPKLQEWRLFEKESLCEGGAYIITLILHIIHKYKI